MVNGVQEQLFLRTLMRGLKVTPRDEGTRIPRHNPHQNRNQGEIPATPQLRLKARFRYVKVPLSNYFPVSQFPITVPSGAVVEISKLPVFLAPGYR